MHLDSDVVFHRPILYKDLFLLGRPTLEYTTYDNLVSAYVRACVRVCARCVIVYSRVDREGRHRAYRLKMYLIPSRTHTHTHPLFSFKPPTTKADTGANRWQNGTAFAVGHSPILYEYSRSNEHVYPREAYAPARAHIEKRFNGLGFADYLATRPGSRKGKAEVGHRTLEAGYIPKGEKDGGDLFSDFNYMGACACVCLCVC